MSQKTTAFALKFIKSMRKKKVKKLLQKKLDGRAFDRKVSITLFRELIHDKNDETRSFDGNLRYLKN